MATSFSGCKTQANLGTVISQISGQDWVLNSLKGNALDPEKYTFKGLPTISFNDSTLVGHTGCNGFNAKYKISDSQNIKIQPGAMTKMYCDGVDEVGFMDAIGETNTLKMDGEQLLLQNGTEELMRFSKK